MFHTPASLNDIVQHFLRLSEAKKILAELNKILHLTVFNPRVSNPCFPLALLASLGTCGILIWHHNFGWVDAQPDTYSTRWRGGRGGQVRMDSGEGEKRFIFVERWWLSCRLDPSLPPLFQHCCSHKDLSCEAADKLCCRMEQVTLY